MNFKRLSLAALLLLGALFQTVAADVQWKHLSSKAGDLPEPNGGKQQTTCVVFDVDGDGANDFVLAERTQAPAIVWMRHTTSGWAKYVVDDTKQTPEAGGVALDVDGDGDLDLVIGGDFRSNELWWYENPAPHFDPKTPWKKHVIKNDGGKAHHDQVVGDFKGTGKPQIAFWNQGAKKLFLADIPDKPREVSPWPYAAIFSYADSADSMKQEGMAAFDVDGDGKMDLLAGKWWFKHTGGNQFTPIQIARRGGRIAAGKFKPGKFPQIVIAPGDGTGPLMFYECNGEPADPKAWVGRDLLGREVVHGHSLQVADIDGDGHLDIFCAEMAKWTEKKAEPDNPQAKAWILYGDGRGSFRVTEFASGIGFHEARVADLNGDGRPDILNKPYNWDTPRVDVWLNPGH